MWTTISRNVRYPDLQDILRDPKTLLLFPGDDATDVQEIASDRVTQHNLVVLDGTWSQARGMYANNKLLKIPRKVHSLSVFM